MLRPPHAPPAQAHHPNAPPAPRPPAFPPATSPRSPACCTTHHRDSIFWLRGCLKRSSTMRIAPQSRRWRMHRPSACSRAAAAAGDAARNEGQGGGQARTATSTRCSSPHRRHAPCFPPPSTQHPPHPPAPPPTHLVERPEGLLGVPGVAADQAQRLLPAVVERFLLVHLRACMDGGGHRGAGGGGAGEWGGGQDKHSGRGARSPASVQRSHTTLQYRVPPRPAAAQPPHAAIQPHRPAAPHRTTAPHSAGRTP